MRGRENSPFPDIAAFLTQHSEASNPIPGSGLMLPRNRPASRYTNRECDDPTGRRPLSAGFNRE